MKIAIIGGRSFLGRHLIAALTNLQDINLAVWQRQPGYNNTSYHHFDYPLKKVDVQKLQTYRFIFYCAGAGVQPGSHESPGILYGINLFEPIRIINQLIENNYAGTFVSFGSYFEIGINRQAKKHTEEAVIFSRQAPFNEYIISKRLLSRFVFDKTSGAGMMKLMHFILPNIYGEDENPERLIPYLVKSFYQNSTVQLSAGKQVRQYLYIKDISRFLANLCRQECQVGGVFNLGGTQEVSPRDIVAMIQKEATARSLAIPEIAFATAQRADAEAPYLGLDDSKARQQLGWAPRTTLKEILPLYFEQYARETH